MAALRSDRIGIPIGLHERRVLTWLRSRADDALAGLEVDPLAVEAVEPPARPGVAAR